MGERERERGLIACLKTHLSLFFRDFFEAKAGLLEEEISRAHLPGFTQTKPTINHQFCEKGHPAVQSDEIYSWLETQEHVYIGQQKPSEELSKKLY